MEIKNHILVAFVLVLVAGSMAAECVQDQKSIYVPAVVGESGGRLLQITARAVPGNGSVYFSTNPTVGVSTQESQQSALANALVYEDLNSTECDYLFTIGDMGDSNYVEGPSAGSGMTLALLAAMENRTIRQDVAFTGAIDGNGDVTAVGGLVEKAQAAAASGMYAIVTPRQEIFEKLMLSDIAEKKGIRIIEVDNIRDAAKIAFSPEGSALQSSNMTLESPKLPENLTGNVQAFSDDDLKAFAKISDAMITVAENEVSAAKVNLNKSQEYDRVFAFFEADLENQRTLLDKGYLFTAANNVFTHLVDISLLQTGTVSRADLENAYAKSNACVMALDDREENIGNFEWVSAARLRKTWALDKINQTNIYNVSGSEENYMAYTNLVYAQDWCLVASLVLDASKGYAGVEVNESVLSGYAKGEIDSASNAMTSAKSTDTDLQWHLDMAKADYGSGYYYAAVMDSQYVSSFLEADSDYRTMNKSELNASIQALYKEQFKSAWAKIYQTQGRYLFDAAGKDPAKAQTAYQILMLSKRLDASFGYAQAMLLEKGKVAEPPVQAAQDIGAAIQAYGAQIFAVLVLIVASIAVFFGFRRYFSGNNASKRKGRR